MGQHPIYLPPSPQTPEHRITKIETVIPSSLFPGLLLVRIHTNTGLIGHGETYYAPHAVAAMLHDWMARRLLGEDALAIESHWRFLYERAANFGVRGAELRAISAIDVALWDILGQVCQQPIYRLLGGPVRSQIPVYNSCGNPSYGLRDNGDQGWPGYGSLGKPGPLQDSYNLLHHPVDLAEELVELGYGALKTWPLDRLAHRYGGMRIPRDELREAVKPLYEIRKHVGMKLEIIVDGHGFFSLPVALQIADALRELQPLWLEDVLKPDNLETLIDFRQRCGLPVSVSEMLLTRADFASVLARGGADYAMIDPTWAGGISETMKITHLAQTYNVPATMHDCTGPLTLFAGLHVNAASSGCCYQETVRAQIQTVYKDLIDTPVTIRNGHIDLPSSPGLGTRLHPALFDPQNENYRISEVKTSATIS